MVEGKRDSAVAPVATPMVAFKNFRRPEGMFAGVIWMVFTEASKKNREEGADGKIASFGREANPGRCPLSGGWFDRRCLHRGIICRALSNGS